MRAFQIAESKRFAAMQEAVWAAIRKEVKANSLVAATLSLLSNAHFFVQLLKDGPEKNTKQVRGWIRIAMQGTKPAAKKIVEEGKSNDKGMGDLYGIFRVDNPWNGPTPSSVIRHEWWPVIAPEFGVEPNLDSRGEDGVRADIKAAAEQAWENKQAKAGKPAKKGKQAKGLPSTTSTAGKKPKAGKGAEPDEPEIDPNDD